MFYKIAYMNRLVHRKKVYTYHYHFKFLLMFTCSIYTGSSPSVTGYFLQEMKKIKGLSARGNSYGETPGMNRTSKIKQNKKRNSARDFRDVNNCTQLCAGRSITVFEVHVFILKRNFIQIHNLGCMHSKVQCI